MELVPRTAVILGTGSSNAVASPTAMPSKPVVVRLSGRTVTDILEEMLPKQRQIIKEVMLEACLLHQFNEARKPGEPPIDWQLPIKRAMNKYPAGRMHKALDAIYWSSYVLIRQFVDTLANVR